MIGEEEEKIGGENGEMEARTHVYLITTSTEESERSNEGHD